MSALHARRLVDAVMASITAEVAGAGTWKKEKYDPVWRNPAKGKLLSVFAGARYPSPNTPGGARWSGSREDAIQIIVEYAEVAAEPATQLDRNEAGELAAYDVADSLETWAQAHQILKATDGSELAHQFDWLRTEYHPRVPRQAFMRYCRVTFQGLVVVPYA